MTIKYTGILNMKGDAAVALEKTDEPAQPRRLIKEMLLNLLSRINLLRATSFSRPDRLSEGLKEVDALFAKMKAHDPVAARLHVRNAEKTALKVLEREAASEQTETHQPTNQGQ